MTSPTIRFDHLNLTVRNFDEAVDWYGKLFGFALVEKGMDEGLVSNPEQWEETIRREKIPIEYGGAIRYPHSTSWYVTDPSGHTIEVTHWNQDHVRFG